MEKIYFYQTLAMTLDAGMTLTESLEVAQSKITNDQFRQVIQGVRAQIQKGDPLAKAMEKFPTAFAETETTIIRSGEQTGHLQYTIATLADSMEAAQAVQSKIKNALIYPATVLLALLVASGFIITTVIPQLLQIYTTSNAQPPASLRTMEWLGRFIGDHPMIILLVLVALVMAIISYVRSKEGQRSLQLLTLRIPYVSTLYKKTVLARVLRTLGLLTESGLGIVSSLKLLGKVAQDHSYQLAFARIRHKVEQGVSLSESVAAESELFPSEISRLLHVGERTANIGPITSKISRQLDRDVDYTLKNITTIIEPVAIVIIGLVVGWFAFLMLGSVFSLTDIV